MTSDATVFLVDDDESLREALAWLLESVDLNVETYPNANAFLESLDDDQPGCLVVDMRMPGMSGLALQRHLKDSAIEIPVIIITGHGDVPMCVEAFQNGAFSFLEKPVNHQKFLDEIFRALEHDARRRERNATGVSERVDQLSPREREVMELIANGKSMKHISSTLGISIQTCSKHRARILEKLGVDNDVELVRSLLLADIDGV